MPDLISYSPWQDAGRLGQGLGTQLQQLLLQLPREKQDLALGRAQLAQVPLQNALLQAKIGAVNQQGPMYAAHGDLYKAQAGLADENTAKIAALVQAAQQADPNGAIMGAILSGKGADLMQGRNVGANQNQLNSFGQLIGTGPTVLRANEVSYPVGGAAPQLGAQLLNRGQQITMPGAAAPTVNTFAPAPTTSSPANNLNALLLANQNIPTPQGTNAVAAVIQQILRNAQVQGQPQATNAMAMAAQPQPQVEDAGDIQEGDTATGPNGEQIIFQGGQWRTIR